MGMAIKLRYNLRDYLVYPIIIVSISFLFYGVESIIETYLRDIDDVVDVIMAIASTLLLLWIRSMIENRRLAEQLRAQSEGRASELERQIGFLGEVAHEFQTPLAILRGHVSSIATAKPTERASIASLATETIDRLSRLVNNLLDVARLDFSKRKTNHEAVDLRDLARDALDDCALLAEDRGVELSVKNADKPVVALIDKDKAKEILLNFLSNALRHTPLGGEIVIETIRDEREVGVAVSDNGCGIASEELPRIFERFYKIPNPANPHSPGTGLGLHICREIAKAHGGDITVVSEPGKGSRFALRLPAVSPDGIINE